MAARKLFSPQSTSRTSPTNSSSGSQRPRPIASIGAEKLQALGIDIHPVPEIVKAPTPTCVIISPKVGSVRLRTEREEDEYRRLRDEEDEYRRLNPLKTISIQSIRRKESAKNKQEHVDRLPISSVPKERLEKLGIDVHEVPQLLELSLVTPNPLIGKALHLHNRSFVYLFPKKNQASEAVEQSSVKAQPASLLDNTVNTSVGCPINVYGKDEIDQLKFSVDSRLRCQQNQDQILADVWSVLHQDEIEKGLHPQRYEKRTDHSAGKRTGQSTGCFKQFTQDLQQNLCFTCCPPMVLDTKDEVDTVALEAGCRWKRKVWRERYLRERFPVGTKFYIDPHIRIDVSKAAAEVEFLAPRRIVPIMPQSAYEELERAQSPEVQQCKVIPKQSIVIEVVPAQDQEKRQNKLKVVSAAISRASVSLKRRRQNQQIHSSEEHPVRYVKYVLVEFKYI